MIKRFEPLEGRNADIIASVMGSPDLEGLDEKLRFKIHLCVEEVEENILCYSGSTWVEITTFTDGEQIVITFRDGGMKFNPLDQEDPDITSSLEERKIGGLGIFLCKQMMDKLEYRLENGCNYFRMTKKIN